MPASWDEFTVTELAAVLGESRAAAEDLLDRAHDLEVKLPGTRAAFRDGIVRESKVEIIARATVVLDADEARAAEALVLDRAGRLTPGGLRAAIACAVMEVAPEKARKRREQAAKDARVQRWEEDSGNAALMSLSNFLCKPGQSLSFCYITVDSFRCPGQTGTRSGNVTANAFMAAFQPQDS